MSDSYLKLVVDGITMDVFPSSKLHQNRIYKKLLLLKGCSLSSASHDEYNDFLLRPLYADGGAYDRVKDPQRFFHEECSGS